MPNDDSKQLIQQLIDEGVSAHEEGNYVLELEIWKRVASIAPDDYYWQANLAMAFFQVGQSMQSIILFKHVIHCNPLVSQAYNNLAVVLTEEGVPVGSLIPYFSCALATSETYEHFLRHLLNYSLSVSLGFDDDEGLAWLDKVHDEAIAFLKRVGDLTDSKAELVDIIVTAFSCYAFLRKSIASRDWTTAFHALEEANKIFTLLGFKSELTRIEKMRPVLELVQKLFDYLERCATLDTPLSTAVNQLDSLHQEASDSIRLAVQTGHSPLINLLGWFVSEFLRQLNWLEAPSSHYDEEAYFIPKSAISAISASDYVDFGERLVEFLSQCNRTLSQLSKLISSLPSTIARNSASLKAWNRIRLHIIGTILDFVGLENELAGEMAGWTKSSAEKLRKELLEFRGYIEGQASFDIYVNKKPQENIARALLQAFLSNRGYREVPSRGGRMDVLIVERGDVFIIETKIWRGKINHNDGLVELEEYAERESISSYAGSFYLVFDPTESRKAQSYVNSLQVRPDIETIVVSISLPIPSKKASTARKNSKS
jgi:hypothetical protein